MSFNDITERTKLGHYQQNHDNIDAYWEMVDATAERLLREAGVLLEGDAPVPEPEVEDTRPVWVYDHESGEMVRPDWWID